MFLYESIPWYSLAMFAVESSHNPTALFVVSAISLAANVAVAVYPVDTIVKRHKNPLRDELYTHLPQYQEVRDANLPVDEPPALPQPASRDHGRLVTA